MSERAIIIGSSTTGKTTLLNYFKEHTDIPVDESDDVLTKLNGGTYPHDSDYKMNVLAPVMVEEILKREQIIFFTNSHYFQAKDLELAHQRGFVVMQLKLAREIMIARNKHRMEHEEYNDLSVHFDSMLQYEDDMHRHKLIDAVIDSNKPLDKIAEEILAKINGK